MRLPFSIILILASCWSCTSHTINSFDAKDACEIASDYTKLFVSETRAFKQHVPELRARSIAVRQTPETLAEIPPNKPRMLGDELTALDHAEDWPKITKLPTASVVAACPNLREWLSEQDVIYEDGQISSRMEPDHLSIIMLTIAMPISTKDGKHAVIFASKSAGGLSAVGVAAIYAKNASGKWSLVKQEQRWIS